MPSTPNLARLAPLATAASLFAASAARADSVVVFNEVHYHPADPAATEWLELHNQMAYDVDLSRWSLRGAVEFTFPDGTVIPSGGFIVAAANPGDLPTPALGPWQGTLDNRGERLRLHNNSGRIMDDLTFSDRGEWPVGPDGTGATLAKSDPRSGTQPASNWRASAQLGGTPGTANFPTDPAPTTTGLVSLGSAWRYDESGADPGPGWPASPHPHWPSGPALIGFEASAGALPAPLATTLADPATNGVTTYYFETSFDLTPAHLGGAVALTLQHVVDDGAVIYLNGTEVARFNMPDGPVSAATTASSPVADASLSDPLDLPTTTLVAGPNRLSAEVHQQAPSSSDIVFGATLTLSHTTPGTTAPSLVINEIAGTSAGAASAVELANTATAPFDASGFTLSSTGTPDSPYTLPEDTVIPAAGFLVVTAAELGFVPGDGDRLFLLSPASDNPRLLVDAARADDQPRARSAAHGGRMLTPNITTFGAANQFEISGDIVVNEIMYHFRDDPGTTGNHATAPLVPTGATWNYDASGADLGGSWHQSAHPPGTAGWLAGPAPIGYETNPDSLPEPIRTTLPPPSDDDVVTYYFETTFDLTPAQLETLTALELTHLVDDGAVFYLNGTEVLRFNLPPGPVGATTTATGVPNATFQTATGLPLTPLVAGTNRLSVEVHQQFPRSSDVVFAARLDATLQTTPVPVVGRDDEWVELFNRGTTTVDLTGWSLDGGITFDFPDNTTLDPGAFLVVARDAASLAAKLPATTAQLLGDFDGRLDNTTDLVRVDDALGNPVDEVRYHHGGRWPALADGDGSSLELRDPDADNSNPQAWAASDESTKTPWQTVSYRTHGDQSYGPTTWNELRVGMLRAGELLVDDVSVVRDPDGAAAELVKDGSFSSGGAAWRLLGNHRHSKVIPEPGNPTNHVLHLIATGTTDTRHNHIETTFANNTSLRPTETYQVSFRARWLAGSNALNTRAYYQRLARTTQLDRPEVCGTPGTSNSTLEPNIGPTVSNLNHHPPLPSPGQPVTISALLADPDGLGPATLHVRTGDGPVQQLPVTVSPDGLASATLTAPPARQVTQFWLTTTDTLGAASHAPAAGPDSRALVTSDDGQGSALNVPEVRLVMRTADLDFMLDELNLMSNERFGTTVVIDRSDVVYDAAVRLRGSGAGRARDGANFRGFNISLPADQPFRGVHDSLSIDRSARTPGTRQQHEIYIKHMFNHAGIPCMFDELIYLVGPSPVYSGTSQMLMARYGGLFTRTQFPDGGDGAVFNLDITYDPTTTVDRHPESLKPPVPFLHVGTDIRDLGDSEEDYRAPFEIRTGRRRDDYSGLIRFCKTIDLPRDQLDARIEEVMDVDEWCRYTALTLLCGIGDSFVTGGLPHNIRLYVPPDGRGVTALPWDMDFVFSASTSASVLPGANLNLADVLAIPRFRRLYWGHLHDITTTTFNPGYMQPWLDHYGALLRQPFRNQSSYIAARRNFALSRLPAEFPFEISTNGGASFSVDATSATLEGRGWIDVRDIRLAGSDSPLPVEWLDGERWRTTVPLAPGTNALTLEAVGFQGAPLASLELVVTSTSDEPRPTDHLRITELHFHPAPPENDAERATGAGSSAFEFVELRNTASAPLRLAGVHFDAGIDFAVPGTTVLPPGAFAVVVADRAAFAARYPADTIHVLGEFAPDALNNGGEALTLRDATGQVIQSFAWDDAWFTAADGPGWSMVARGEGTLDPDLTTPAAWVLSATRHGNPGTANGPDHATEFAVWQRHHFSPQQLDDPAVSSPSATSTGLPNLVRYALGLAPGTPGSGALPTVTTTTDNNPTFTFRRQRLATDLAVTPQLSTDLHTWSPITSPPIAVTDNGDGTESVTLPLTPLPSLHTRLHVKLSAP